MKKGLFFVVIILVLIFIGLRRSSASFFSVKKYTCVAPKGLSESYFSSIHKALAEMIAQNSATCDLINQLQTQFPILNKIIISYRPLVMRIEIFAYEPICCINNQTVIMSNNVMCPKDFFSEIILENIPNFRVFPEDMTHIPQYISSLLRELPSDFNQLYNLEFINDHYICLVDKKEPNFMIIFTIDQEKSSLLFSQCELVKKNIMERSGFNKRVKWVVDTRFTDYIVAYKA